MFFVPGAACDKPLAVSSATAFATPAGRPVVLTAGHCARDATDQPIRLGYYKCTQVLQDVVAGVAKHSDRSVDIAALALKPNVRGVLRPFTVTLDIVTSDDDIRPDTDALVVAGFPASLASGTPDGVPRYGFRSVT